MIWDLNSFHVFKGWRVPWDGPRYAVSRNGNPRSLTVLSTSCTVIEPPTKAVSNLFFKPTFVLVLSVSAPRTIPTTMAAYRLKKDRLLPCQRTLCTTWKNTTPIRKNLILKGSLNLRNLFLCVLIVSVFFHVQGGHQKTKPNVALTPTWRSEQVLVTVSACALPWKNWKWQSAPWSRNFASFLLQKPLYVTYLLTHQFVCLMLPLRSSTLQDKLHFDSGFVTVLQPIHAIVGVEFRGKN